MRIDSPVVLPTHPRVAELERLGDEIAELSAHLDAATARLLALIREFDARGGWNTGFHSCAAWLSWRVGLDLGAARERVRVARALATLPLLAVALARGELSYAKVARSLAWPRRRRKRGCWQWGARGRRPTWSGSCGAGGGWTGWPRRARRRGSTRSAASTSTRTRTARWSSAADWPRRWGRCSCGRSTPRGRRSISERASRRPRQRPPTPPCSPRPGRSSRRTPSPCSRRRPCTTSSIPARRASGTRWWSTWKGGPADHARKPRPPLSAPSSRGPRRGLQGCARA